MAILVNPNMINAPGIAMPPPARMQQNLMFGALEAYYHNNGLYDQLVTYLVDNNISTPALKPLRNPAHRSVEFYASHLWPGNLEQALPIITDNPRLTPAIYQIWSWSAWETTKQRAARWFALFGNLFLAIRVSEDRTKVYFQPVHPSDVTDFRADHRGFLQWIRIDVKTTDEDDQPITHTEVYDKTSLRIWDGNHTSADKIRDLGPARLEIDLRAEYGIDFVPVVYAQFLDTGEQWGNGCFVHALDKIDEINRQVTRLHQMLYRYNKPLFAVQANANGPDGQPLPPPRFGSGNNLSPVTGNPSIAANDDDVYMLPGMSTMQTMVPSIAWADALAIAEAMAQELRRDLPELLFYDLASASSDLSGKAIRALLAGAIAKCVEARGQAESALSRADEIALSIASFIGVPGFETVGQYANGDFNHSFAERDVIPVTESERAETLRSLTQATVPLATAMKIAGYDQAEIDAAAEQKAADAAASQQSLAAAMAGFNAQ